ncbi:hypothetical protein C7N43_27260 [Sphingobacteriales bacterium UPWRP_1]|nr:hypothetical protein C7N43_27260 [Sphingobacteriales bacterium UPWRP_1]
MKFNIGNTTFQELASLLHNNMPGYTVKPAGNKLILCTKGAVLAQIKWESKEIIAIRTDLNMKNIPTVLFVAIPAGIAAAVGGFLFAFLGALAGFFIAKMANNAAMEECNEDINSALSKDYKRVE